METKVITKDIVKKAHQHQLEHGGNNQKHLQELVNIMGGMDQILSNYLEHITTNAEQLTQIHQLITQNQNQNKKTDTNIQLQNNANLNIELHNHPHIALDPQNNYLSSIFGKPNALKILYIMNHRVTQLFMTLLVILFIVGNYVSIIASICARTLLIPYGILLILSVNKHVFSLIIHGFEFWFKMYYGLVYMCAMTAISAVNINVFHSERCVQCVIVTSISTLCLSLSIIVVSLFDGILVLNKWTKIICCAAVGWYFLFLSALDQVYLYQTDIDETLVHVLGFNISLIAVQMIGRRIIAIYFIKQSFNEFRNRKTAKATLISMHPILEWDKNSNNEAVLTDIVQHQ